MYAIGQIWAGDVIDETISTSTASGMKTNGQKNGWRHAIPACAFPENSKCAAIELGDTTIVQAKLHLDILRVSKAVHAETRDVLFKTNIFALSHHLALVPFLMPHSDFDRGHLGRIRNVSLCVRPLKLDMLGMNWSLRHIDNDHGRGVDNLAGLRRLQIVIQCDAEYIDLPGYDYTDMWRVSGLLSFARMEKLVVAVDASLAHDGKDSKQRDRAENYARMLEERIARPGMLLSRSLRDFESSTTRGLGMAGFGLMRLFTFEVCFFYP
jgi:hypothetical protein